MSGRKTSSAKKRQAPEPQVVSPDPVTPVSEVRLSLRCLWTTQSQQHLLILSIRMALSQTPTTRNTANSRRIAEENKEPSREYFGPFCTRPYAFLADIRLF